MGKKTFTFIRKYSSIMQNQEFNAEAEDDSFVEAQEDFEMVDPFQSHLHEDLSDAESMQVTSDEVNRDKSPVPEAPPFNLQADEILQVREKSPVPEAPPFNLQADEILQVREKSPVPEVTPFDLQADEILPVLQRQNTREIELQGLRTILQECSPDMIDQFFKFSPSQVARLTEEQKHLYLSHLNSFREKMTYGDIRILCEMFTKDEEKRAFMYYEEQYNKSFGSLEIKLRDWVRFELPILKERTKKMNIDTLKQILFVINCVFKITRNHFLRPVQLASVVLMLLKPRRTGRLLEIKTGEGKSNIVIALAIVRSLFSKSAFVDVVTSHEELAIREAEASADIFEFFGLTCGTNITAPGEPLPSQYRECYDRHVVFGTPASFMFDLLGTEYYLQGQRDLERRPFATVIADEVDSMFMDRAMDVCRLAGYAVGYSDVSLAVMKIWMLMSRVEIEKSGNDETYNYCEERNLSRDDLLGRLDSDMRAYLNSWHTANIHTLANDTNQPPGSQHYSLTERGLAALNTHNMLFPTPYAAAYLTHHLGKYLTSAISAKFHMHPKVDYRIANNQIIIVDQSTGEDKLGMSWRDGMHQFLQLKHGLEIDKETLETNLMTAKSFFLRYSAEEEINQRRQRRLAAEAAAVGAGAPVVAAVAGGARGGIQAVGAPAAAGRGARGSATAMAPPQAGVAQPVGAATQPVAAIAQQQPRGAAVAVATGAHLAQEDEVVEAVAEAVFCGAHFTVEGATGETYIIAPAVAYPTSSSVEPSVVAVAAVAAAEEDDNNMEMDVDEVGEDAADIFDVDAVDGEEEGDIIESGIFGLSGTLGRSAHRLFLSEVYKIDCLDMPTNKPILRKTGVCTLQSEPTVHLQQILQSCQQRLARHRPVLILADTIALAEEIFNYWKLTGPTYVDVKMKVFSVEDKDFVKQNQRQEQQLQQRQRQPGLGSETAAAYDEHEHEHGYHQAEEEEEDKGYCLDVDQVLIATNLLGRGADIDLTQAAIDCGGLHVCVAFVPPNHRVLCQAYGRAGRKGLPGSCEVIALNTTKKSSNDIHDNATDGQRRPAAIFTPEEFENTIFRHEAEELRVLRSRVEVFDAQEKAFRRYCALLRQMPEIVKKPRKNNNDNNNNNINIAANMRIDMSHPIFRSVEEVWARFFRTYSEYPDLLEALFDEEVSIPLLQGGTDGRKALVTSPGYLVRLSNRSDISSQQAVRYCEQALEKDPRHVPAVMQRVAHLLNANTAEKEVHDRHTLLQAVHCAKEVVESAIERTLAKEVLLRILHQDQVFYTHFANNNAATDNVNCNNYSNDNGNTSEEDVQTQEEERLLQLQFVLQLFPSDFSVEDLGLSPDSQSRFGFGRNCSANSTSNTKNVENTDTVSMMRRSGRVVVNRATDSDSDSEDEEDNSNANNHTNNHANKNHSGNNNHSDNNNTNNGNSNNNTNASNSSAIPAVLKPYLKCLQRLQLLEQVLISCADVRDVQAIFESLTAKHLHFSHKHSTKDASTTTKYRYTAEDLSILSELKEEGLSGYLRPTICSVSVTRCAWWSLMLEILTATSCSFLAAAAQMGSGVFYDGVCLSLPTDNNYHYNQNNYVNNNNSNNSRSSDLCGLKVVQQGLHLLCAAATPAAVTYYHQNNNTYHVNNNMVANKEVINVNMTFGDWFNVRTARVINAVSSFLQAMGTATKRQWLAQGPQRLQTHRRQLHHRLVDTYMLMQQNNDNGNSGNDGYSGDNSADKDTKNSTNRTNTTHRNNSAEILRLLLANPPQHPLPLQPQPRPLHCLLPHSQSAQSLLIRVNDHEQTRLQRNEALRSHLATNCACLSRQLIQLWHTSLPLRLLLRVSVLLVFYAGQRTDTLWRSLRRQLSYFLRGCDEHTQLPRVRWEGALPALGITQKSQIFLGDVSHNFAQILSSDDCKMAIFSLLHDTAQLKEHVLVTALFNCLARNAVAINQFYGSEQYLHNNNNNNSSSSSRMVKSLTSSEFDREIARVFACLGYTAPPPPPPANAAAPPAPAVVNNNGNHNTNNRNRNRNNNNNNNNNNNDNAPNSAPSTNNAHNINNANSNAEGGSGTGPAEGPGPERWHRVLSLGPDPQFPAATDSALVRFFNGLLALENSLLVPRLNAANGHTTQQQQQAAVAAVAAAADETPPYVTHLREAARTLAEVCYSVLLESLQEEFDVRERRFVNLL